MTAKSGILPRFAQETNRQGRPVFWLQA